jgi:Protein of unknown function (DUF4019)
MATIRRCRNGLLVHAFLSALALAPPAVAATAEPTSSAMQWVTMLDHGKYTDCYADSSAIFRARVTEVSFENTIKLYRDTVGPLIHRDVEGVSMAGKLANLPTGQYAVVHFHANFRKMPDALETVYLAAKNGLWHVAAYDIK